MVKVQEPTYDKDLSIDKSKDYSIDELNDIALHWKGAKPVRGALAAGMIESNRISSEANSASKNIGQRFDDQISNTSNDDEAVDFRHSDMLSKSFGTARQRGDFFDDEFAVRSVNARWFGAVGDGKTDDTDSILKAYAVAQENGAGIFIPAGTYMVKFNDTNMPESQLFWGYGQVVNDGKAFRISGNFNQAAGSGVQNPLHVARHTYGRYGSAAAGSVVANSPDGHVEVMGINDDSKGLESYDNRDSVGFFVSNTTNALMIKAETTGFGTNYVDVATDADLSNAVVGMFIDTNEKPKKTGIITGITGNRITVNKWIAFGDATAGQQPATGSSIIINPLTAIWGQNTIVQLDETGPSVAATGYELDVLNNQPHLDNVDGYTSILMGKYGGHAAYTARSAGNGNWTYGLYSTAETGVRHVGGSTGVSVSGTKFASYTSNGSPVAFYNTGVATDLLLHAVDADGNALFDMDNDGEMHKLRLLRSLRSGMTATPVTFAQGNVVFPAPSASTNEVKIVVNVTSSTIQITAPINFQGRVLQAIGLRARQAMIFICDGNGYYLLDTAGAVA